VRSYREDGQTALPLCQQALTLLSADNYLVRAQTAGARLWAYYTSATNDAVTAIQHGLQAVSLAQAAGLTTLALALMSSTVMHIIGAGQLHEVYQLTQQAMQLRTQSADFTLSEVGWPMLLHADILREWNQLDAALALAEESISLCKQTASSVSLFFLLCGYAVLLRVHLSRGELDAACSALQEFENIGLSIDQDFDSYVRSHFTTIDQMRLWLASGKLDRATRWAQELEVREQHGTSFARERTEVARIRLFLAKDQPTLALQRLEPVLTRATTGQRWDHVIEIRILQALTYQILQQETQALEALAEAIHLAEPQGYIRRFVDEGTPMAALLSKLQKQQHEAGPNPYLDTLLAAFPQQSKAHKRQPKRARARNKIPPL
jgi:LuxR family maltose regulon positive regulatory protein